MPVNELIATYAPLSYGLLFSFGLIAFLLLVSFILDVLPSCAHAVLKSSGVCGGGLDASELYRAKALELLSAPRGNSAITPLNVFSKEMRYDPRP